MEMLKQYNDDIDLTLSTIVVVESFTNDAYMGSIDCHPLFESINRSLSLSSKLPFFQFK